jgi:cell division protein ZapA
MADTSKVTVRIYGHEYTISGDRPAEQIEDIAAYVDKVMADISEAIGGGSVSSLAVLTALNVASDFFDLRAERGGADDENERLRIDAEHCSQQLERSKTEFQQYKHDAAEKLERVSALQEKVDELSAENERLSQEASKSDKRAEELAAQNKNLNERLRARDDAPAVSNEQSRELEDRLKEVEGNYFELQMENIRLRGDLERYRSEED